MDPSNDQKSLRDEFAMAALIGILANFRDPSAEPYNVAQSAYRAADAMLEARKK